MPDTVSPKLFALLIGIDRYSQTPLSDGTYYPNLGGCVRDIEMVEQMLKSRLKLPDGRITKLISRNSDGDDDKPFVNSPSLPTYKNLVKAFKDLTKKAREGDQIYIHYSGHGGRCATMFPELKGANGLDESVVPCDIGQNGACYLRDIEMAYLLKTMGEKKLTVTIVLDSCHSGGATRAFLFSATKPSTATVRCVPGFIDMTPPPKNSLVLNRVKLVAAFKSKSTAAVSRNVNATSGWRIGAPENCVLIAACRADELANEDAFGDGGERNGALTYWMLDALKQMGDGYTYKMLYNRVAAKVRARFAEQTPQIEGDREREIFGGVKLTTAASVNVLEVDLTRKRIRLETGVAQGIAKGAQFAVFAANVRDFNDAAKRLAVVETDEPEADEMWANVVEGARANEIEQGSQAVLIGVGISLRGRVHLVSQPNVYEKTAQAAALKKLRDIITKKDEDVAAKDKWIRLAKTGETVDFQVAVNARGEYEIRDANGSVLPNLRPALNVGDNDAASNVARRLVHLTKYRNVRLIDNTDPTSPLARKIIAELGILKKEKNKRDVFTALSVPVRPLSVGEQVCLRVTNLSDKKLNVAIIDLAPDWGVSQIFPIGKNSELLETGADNALHYEMEAYLPEGYSEGADTIKVFATSDDTDFGWLAMQPLDVPPIRSAKRGLPVGNSLEKLMIAFNAPNLRNMRPVVNLSAPAGKTWTTAEVELRVRRPSIAHVSDPALSLLQSAFDQIDAEKKNPATRGGGKTKEIIARPRLNDPTVNLIAQYCVAASRSNLNRAVSFKKKDASISVDASLLEQAQERGAVDTVKYCAAMTVGMAKNLWDAKINGNTKLYDQYAEALMKKMSDCDPRYGEAVAQYLNFLAGDESVPYRKPESPDDFVIDGRLPANAVVGIVADWATGEPEALEVLRQVKNHNPQIAIHLGDVYYAGTQYEVDNYFYKPWTEILKPAQDKVLSLTLPGNHDLYAGGKPYYDLIDRLSKLGNLNQNAASYFCLRNEHWQIIGLDTALHDRLGGKPTFLEDTEVEWLAHKFETANGRRTILLSHHQLFSANDQFKGKSYNEKFYKQVEKFLTQTDLWLWGHEHDVFVFDEFKKLKRGRCIGGSAFPVGNFELPATTKNPDVPFDRQVALRKGKAFYSHCYTILKLDGASVTVSYYEDDAGGRLLYEETL